MGSALLHQDDVQFYRNNGYLVVHGVVSAKEVAAMRQVAERWVEASRDVELSDHIFDLEPGHSVSEPRVRRIKNPTVLSDAYDGVMRSDAVLDVVEALIGPNIRWHGTKLNMKSAVFGSPVGWHQDWAFYPHTNDDLLVVGVPIDDMTTANGCLLVLPGSHRGAVLDHHARGVFVGSIDPAMIDSDRCLPLEAPAGSITVHHARLLHGSAPNRSGPQRRLFLIEYVSGDAWPLVHETWSVLVEKQLRGLTTSEPRMESLPVRMPWPLPEKSDTIYELQSTEPSRIAFGI